MPSNLVRVTIDKETNGFTVEYGEETLPGLTDLEEIEFKQLNEDLIEYSDFTEAENLEDEERKQLMEKKKRLEELVEKRVREHVNWYPIEGGLIESLLIILSPRVRHTYVENLPEELLDKIMDPSITLNVSTGPPWVEGASRFPVGPPKHEEKETPADDVGALEGVTTKELKIIEVLASAKANWTEYVSVEEKEGVVYVRPHKFLGDVWGPINAALKKAYGDPWKSKGSGDREAHWEIDIK